jgi:hypothetical protein
MWPTVAQIQVSHDNDVITFSPNVIPYGPKFSDASFASTSEI